MTNTQIWDKYYEGLYVEWVFSISEDEIKKFSDLSGDRNPLHSDRLFAQSKGFENPLVNGLLLSAQMSRLIGEEMPDKNSIIISIQMDFLLPCFPGDKLIFTSNLTSKSNSTNTYRCKCKIIRDEKTMCKGTVEAIWKP